MKFLIPFLIAFIGSKLIFRLFDFNYSLFSDPFDGVKLLIDTGVFFILFVLGTMLSDKILK
jgi:hypothetical protein